MSDTDLLAPIAGDNPAGVSVRGEAVYQQIKLARFEEDDVPQGEWQRERKTADYVQVVKLATDVLARQSKDLQVAAWLTEAWTRREGFAGLTRGLQLLHALLDRFWDHVHPEPEDGDLELRAAPLEWVELYLGPSVRAVPLTRAGHGLLVYRESRHLGYEEAVKADSTKHAEWQAAVAAGKVSADAFDKGLAETPGTWVRDRVAEVDAAIAALDALAALCEERFGEYAPRFIKLREMLVEVRHLAGQFLAKKAETDPELAAALAADPSGNGAGAAAADAAPSSNGASGDASASTASAGAAPAPAAAAPSAASAGWTASTDSSAGPPASREDAAARIAAVARWLRAQRLADPAPYLMLRGFRWGELRAGGPVPDPRLLAAPPTADRVRLKTLALDEKWAQLLEAAEEVMAREHGRGWLDLQRYVAAACTALGPDYDAVRAAVAGALRALLHDLPTLPSLTLMDDTPTANAETRAWLAQARIAGEGGAEAPSAAPRLGDAEGRARARAAAGEPLKAVEILTAAAEQEKTPRARFLLRSQAAAVMVDAKLEAVAVPILRELLEQVQRYSLEEWEAGEVVAHPIGLLYRCLGTLGDGAGEREALYLRVCRLDPLRAITLREAADAAAA
jgi:type VI secretion system protein ImpA